MAANRIFGLDLLRCLAIILVLITHTIPLLDPAGFVKISVYTGYFGVELFFVLSGFLIGTILLKVYYQENQLNFSNIKIFWMRRWFRTLPNYYLMFLVYGILLYFAHHLNVFGHIRYLSYLFFLQNSVTPQPNEFFPVAWSLSVEEWFYLIFPVLLFLLTKVFYKKRALSFLITILSIIIFELAFRIYVAVFMHHTWDEGFRKLMPLRLDSIDIGVLAAYIKYHKPSFWINKAKILAVFGVIILAGLALYFSRAYAVQYDAVTWDHNFNAGIFLETIFFTLTSFSIALLIPFLYSINVKKGAFSNSVTFISTISYSIYLTHLLVILVLSHILKHYEAVKYFNILSFIIAWVVIISLSAVQYNYFEVKMTALRNRLSRKQAAIKI